MGGWKLTGTGVGVVIAGIRVLAVLLVVVSAVVAPLQAQHGPQTRQSGTDAEHLLRPAVVVAAAVRTRRTSSSAVPSAPAGSGAAVSAGSVVAVSLVFVDFCAAASLLAAAEDCEDAIEETAHAAVEADESE